MLKFMLKLSFKNLTRHKRRTAITSVSIAFGLAMFVWTDSLLLGMKLESTRNIQWYEHPPVKIVSKDYDPKESRKNLKHLIDNPREVEKMLEAENIPYARRAIFTAEAVTVTGDDSFSENRSKITQIIAIDPQKDGQVFRLSQHLRQGGRPLRENEYSVLLGGMLAANLKADIGYKLKFRTKTKDGDFQVFTLKVAGIVDAPNSYVSRATVFMPLKTANQALYLDGSVTEIAVFFPFDADTAAVSRNLKNNIGQNLSDLKMLTWRDMSGDYLAVQSADSKGSQIILFMVFIIAAVGVSNTVLISTLERTREIGMMRAQGLSGKKIRQLLLTEAGGIGFLGGLIGALLGFVIVAINVNIGIDYSSFLRQTDLGYRTSGILYGAWNPPTFMAAFLIGIAMSVVVAFFPVRRALKVSITEALRSR